MLPKSVQEHLPFSVLCLFPPLQHGSSAGYQDGQTEPHLISPIYCYSPRLNCSLASGLTRTVAIGSAPDLSGVHMEVTHIKNKMGPWIVVEKQI